MISRLEEGPGLKNPGCSRFFSETGAENLPEMIFVTTCDKHHKQCLCKIIITRVKVHFADVF